MDNLSPQQLLKIWEKGKYLDKALQKFCMPIYMKKYYPHSLKSSAPEQNTPMNNIIYAAQVAGEYVTQQNNLHSILCEKIKNGDLVALGYEQIKSPDFPMIIPPYMWPPKNIHAGESTISKNDLNFLSVRIVRKSVIKRLLKAPEKIENKEAALPKFKKENKKLGRPSLAKQIIAAYEALRKSGQIKYSESQIYHVSIVRDAVWVLYPELKGSACLEDEAIRNKIAPLFNAEKAAQKVTQKL